MSQPNQPTGQGDSWYQEDSGQKAKKFPLGGPTKEDSPNDSAQNHDVPSQQQQQYDAPPQSHPQQNPNPFNPFGGPNQEVPAQQQSSAPQQGTTPGQYGGGIDPQVGSSDQAPHQSFSDAPHSAQNNEQTDQHQPAQSAPAHQNDNVSGIYNPRTGEVMPVADLNRLQDTDALLVVVSGPDAGAQILLDTDVVTVGRSPNADIFLDDVTVSRKHAEFVRTPSGFTLRDTGSLNGTYVGRQLIDSVELRNGADVQIGKFRMIFQQRPRQ